MDPLNCLPINPPFKSPMPGESECLNQAEQGKFQDSRDLNQRVKQSKDVPLNLLDLPLDIFREIFRYLNRRSLLNFEATQKDSEEKTKDAWEWRKAKYHFKFKWKSCEKEKNPPKWEFSLSQLVPQYIFTYRRQLVQAHSSEIAQEIAITIFRGLPDRFSFIHHYINHDISRLTNGSKLDTTLILPEGEQGAGESLLQGLWHMASDSNHIEIIEQCFAKAIQEGATYTSLLSIATSPEGRDDICDMNLKLAIAAAEKGDERALGELLVTDEYSAHVLCERQDFYCVLVYLAKTYFDQGRIDEASELIDKALQFKKIPLLSEEFLPTLYKVELGLYQAFKYAHVDKLYAQVFVEYGEQVPPYVLADAAFAKFRLNQLSEADQLYRQAMDKYDGQVPADVLVGAALVKRQLNQLSEANQLYSQAIAEFGEQVSADVLANAALLKYKLLYPWLNEFYSKAIVNGEQDPADVLVDAAFVKYGLNQLSEIDELFSRAIDKFDEQVPGDVLANAALIKFELNELYEENQFLYEENQLLKANPFLLLYKANALYIKAKLKLGEKVSPQILKEAEEVKLKLELKLKHIIV